MDSNISDVEDFNLDVMKQHEFRKIESLCNEYNMIQCIEESTHFTENSISTIDLLFVSNKDSILTTGVGEPCLSLTIRYHCPIFGVFNFLKPKVKSIHRTIWKYEQRHYNELRNGFANFNLDSLKDSDINIYAENVSDTISEYALKFIPNKKVSINPQEPVWMNATIKKEIRRRKMLYRKTKESNNASCWQNPSLSEIE